MRQVSPKATLLTPVQCKSLWRQFKAETEYSVTQAISAQVPYTKYFYFSFMVSFYQDVCSYSYLVGFTILTGCFIS